MSLSDKRFLCLSGGGVITRYFAELDSVLNSHLVYANTLVFGSGDTYKGKFLAPTSLVASNERITDGDNTGNPALFELASDGTYNISGNMTVTVGGASVTGASSYPTDGKLVEYEFTFTGAGRIKFIGKNEASSSNFYNGIPADLVATIGGVTTANEVGAALLGGNSEPSITSGPANSLQPSFIPDANIEQYTLIDGSWLGQELVVNGGFDTDSDWVKGTGWSIGLGKASCDGSQAGNTLLSQSNTLTAGTNYIVSYLVSDYVSGSVTALRGGLTAGGNGTPATSDGEHVDTGLADGPIFHLRGNSSFVGSVDNASVKRLIEIAS